MRDITLAALTVVSWLVAGSFSPAAACTCVANGPVCQAFWSDYAVFDATVLAIDEVAHEELIGDHVYTGTQKLVTLEVIEAWKGATAGRMQVLTPPDTGACGFPFMVGKRYLVFGRQGPGQLIAVSLCSPTREFDGTGEVAAFLASLEEPPRGGRIFGSVRRHAGEKGQPVPIETTVRLLGGGQAVTKRSVGGHFEFAGLEPGGYQIVLDVPRGFEASPRSVQLVNARACAEADFWIRDAGRITGRAVDASGRGVPRLTIELAAEGIDLQEPFGPGIQTAHTDDQGYFELSHLAAGRYLVGLSLRNRASEYSPYSRFIYASPGRDPEILELARGESMDIGQWQVPPPLGPVPITGWVVWRDGSPADRVNVMLRDVTDGSAFGHVHRSAVTDVRGGFTIPALATRTYRVTVSPAGKPGQFTTTVPALVAAPGLQPLRVVIQADRPPR